MRRDDVVEIIAKEAFYASMAMDHASPALTRGKHKQNAYVDWLAAVVIDQAAQRNNRNLLNLSRAAQSSNYNLTAALALSYVIPQYVKTGKIPALRTIVDFVTDELPTYTKGKVESALFWLFPDALRNAIDTFVGDLEFITFIPYFDNDTAWPPRFRSIIDIRPAIERAGLVDHSFMWNEWLPGFVASGNKFGAYQVMPLYEYPKDSGSLVARVIAYLVVASQRDGIAGEFIAAAKPYGWLKFATDGDSVCSTMRTANQLGILPRMFDIAKEGVQLSEYVRGSTGSNYVDLNLLRRALNFDTYVETEFNSRFDEIRVTLDYNPIQLVKYLIEVNVNHDKTKYYDQYHLPDIAGMLLIKNAFAFTSATRDREKHLNVEDYNGQMQHALERALMLHRKLTKDDIKEIKANLRQRIREMKKSQYADPHVLESLLDRI